jgi:hypothetical protein
LDPGGVGVLRGKPLLTNIRSSNCSIFDEYIVRMVFYITITSFPSPNQGREMSEGNGLVHVLQAADNGDLFQGAIVWQDARDSTNSLTSSSNARFLYVMENLRKTWAVGRRCEEEKKKRCTSLHTIGIDHKAFEGT